MPVILINPFEVPATEADRFVRSWAVAADYMRRQSGFIATRLHRALAPDARFGFINVAEWESPQHLMNAIQTSEFKEMASASPPNFPALYEIVQTEGPTSAAMSSSIYQGEI